MTHVGAVCHHNSATPTARTRMPRNPTLLSGRGNQMRYAVRAVVAMAAAGVLSGSMTAAAAADDTAPADSPRTRVSRVPKQQTMHPSAPRQRDRATRPGSATNPTTASVTTPPAHTLRPPPPHRRVRPRTSRRYRRQSLRRQSRGSDRTVDHQSPGACRRTGPTGCALRGTAAAGMGRHRPSTDE